MHSCLLISEIISEIFANVFSSETGSADIASLARTCRAFCEPALDILWRNLFSLAPLVMCMSDDLVERVRVQTNNKWTTTILFRRAPSPADWHHALKYVGRIRTIRLVHSRHASQFKLHPSILPQLLVLCSGAALLPNVSQLHYQESDHDADESMFVSGLEMLACNSLRYLAVKLPVNMGQEQIDDLFASVAQKCSLMEDLCLYSENPRMLSTSRAVQNLARLQQLRSISLGWLDGQEEIASILQSCGRKCFPMLTRLRLAVESMSSIIMLLESIQSHSLKDLDISTRLPVTAESLRMLICTLHSHSEWLNTLECISLYSARSSYSAIPGDTIKPLLSFSNVRWLAFGNTGVDIDDGMLGDMALAWPHLEKFSFRNFVSPMDTGGITLNGLIPFASRCQCLSLLQMQLNASAIPDLPSRLLRRSGLSTCTEKRMKLVLSGASEILDAGAVAAFLSNFFQKLELLYLPEERDDPYNDLWRQVAQLLQKD